MITSTEEGMLSAMLVFDVRYLVQQFGRPLSHMTYEQRQWVAGKIKQQLTKQLKEWVGAPEKDSPKLS